MPEIDYVVLAEYVRQDAGMTHIMGAGIDTFFVPEGQPVAVPVGIVARISFTSRDDVGVEHEISLVFQGPDGDLLTVHQRFPTPAPQPDVPEHWRTTVSIAFRLALPIPGRGDYRLQVTLDDDPLLSRSLDVRAIAPPTGQN
jgi:hypothetical protein